MIAAAEIPSIAVAGLSDLDDLTQLFEAYRLFYACSPDPERARAYLGERIAKGEATFLLARIDGTPAGFAALYPAFSTLRMTRMFEVEDLFVTTTQRRSGIGAALLARCEALARESGADSLTLMTAFSNRSARRAYENAGWVRDDTFLTYNRTIG